MVVARDLEREFNRYGRITDLWVARNPPGFAFIDFSDERDAREAVRDMDGRTILDKRVRVEISRRGRAGRGGGPSGGGRDRDRVRSRSRDRGGDRDRGRDRSRDRGGRDRSRDRNYDRRDHRRDDYRRDDRDAGRRRERGPVIKRRTEHRVRVITGLFVISWWL